MGPELAADEMHETIIDPDMPIIDAHFHFLRIPEYFYEVAEYARDTSSGHNIVKSVFIECSQDFASQYPPHLRVIGETKYAVELAMDARERGGPEIAGIVARADLRLGDAVEEVLNGHLAAAGDLFKGIRQIAICDPYPTATSIPESFAPHDLYEQAAFRRGLRRLGKMGFSFDAWHYHHQLRAFLRLARATPDTMLVLDHFGTPLGVGPYRDRRKEIFDQWREDISELAKCHNVVAKLGGLAMKDNGFGWDGQPMPPSSDIFVSAQAPYYHHTIESFGPERCMFESNFPVDKESLPYDTLFNAFKKIARCYTPAQQHHLFYETANRIYRL